MKRDSVIGEIISNYPCINDIIGKRESDMRKKILEEIKAKIFSNLLKKEPSTFICNKLSKTQAG